jgi:hypothetical protein
MGRGTRPRSRPDSLTCYFDGVSEGIRTPDIQDHNLALCQLSYAHHGYPGRGGGLTARVRVSRRTRPKNHSGARSLI